MPKHNDIMPCMSSTMYIMAIVARTGELQAEVAVVLIGIQIICHLNFFKVNK
jgi:hypothetical protein